MSASFTGGGNPSIPNIKSQTYRKSLTNFITQCCIEYILPRFELTTLVVIGTDCIFFLIQLPYHHDHDGPVTYDKS